MTPVHHGRQIRSPTVRWLWRHHRWQICPPAIQAKAGELSLKARRPWLVPVGPRIVKYYDFCLLGCVPEHLDRFWAVLVVSGAQNRPITSFFDTPWTFFAPNVAKVYGGSTRPGNLPRNQDDVRKMNCAPKVGHNKFKHERIKVSN